MLKESPENEVQNCEKEEKKTKKNDYRIRMTPPKSDKVKMRLREDSPESPRRIIDNIRGYR